MSRGLAPGYASTGETQPRGDLGHRVGQKAPRTPPHDASFYGFRAGRGEGAGALGD